MNRVEGVASEAAVLVGVLLPDRQLQSPLLDELEGLAEAAGARVVGQLTQRRESPDAATYLGKGKVEELTRLAKSRKADVVVFDNDLSPGQTRNLEQATGVKVIDRTELILDIFASRAQTYEARLAVELAQLEYSMPRLKRMWTHLSRQKKGIGLRGPGEKQLEVDRRLVEKRISELRNELAAVHKRKQREVAARSDRMTVSLVGYTNAGKSTLLNQLTGADVYTEDLLFATLDTRTRRWQLPGWGPVLLSDTVGFIRDLPHHLIASFRATLEEARQADLLLHVADASNPVVGEQIAAAYRVLEEIGLEQKDTLLVLNKVDMLPDRARLDSLLGRYPTAIPISARSGLGVRHLATAVSDALTRGFRDVDIETGVGNGRLLAYLAAHGEILSKQYHDGRVTIHCRMSQRHLGRIHEDGAVVRPHASNGSGVPVPGPAPGTAEEVA
ncbi:MAG: GTPase HflX [Pirellulales bacterium]|nr:GTPase HflX [Pirellulales bacterium]